MAVSDPQQKNLQQIILDDHIVLTGMITACLLTLGQWLVIAVYIWQLPPQIPLFYSHIAGHEQLAIRNWLFIIPVISSMSVIICWLILKFSTTLISVFHQLVSWFTALIIFIASVSLIHIIILVY